MAETSSTSWQIISVSITIAGSVVAYFVQRWKERREEKEEAKKRASEEDRQHALERVRKQLSLFIGPLHRLYKTHNAVILQYCHVSGHGVQHAMAGFKNKGRCQWRTLLSSEFLQSFIDDPDSPEAQRYRNAVIRQFKPLFTRMRELILLHGTDLADMPSQDEWFERYPNKESITSPIHGSMHINVIFDTFSAWTYEFDDIIESWTNDKDYRRMQPSVEVNWRVLNELVDLLHDNAKEKESKYNKHVKIHKNVANPEAMAQLSRVSSSTFSRAQSLMAKRSLVGDEVENDYNQTNDNHGSIKI